MIMKTARRVEMNSPADANQKIRRKTRDNIRVYAHADRDLISKRLRALDAEWDIERILETNASSLLLFGLFLSLKRRFWTLLPIGVAAFLLQHALQGWCPPMPLLRRLGFRTTGEINEERNALENRLSRSRKPAPLQSTNSRRSPGRKAHSQ